MVGNQLPILLINFTNLVERLRISWESVTNPLDKLQLNRMVIFPQLGISYQSS